MTTNEEMKQTLKQEEIQIDHLLATESRGLFSMLIDTWRGGMRWWVLIVNIFVLMVSAALVLSAYQFYTAQGLNEQIFWGVSFLAILQVQVATKMWVFMEMNRISTIREIKRIELKLSHVTQTSP